LSLGGVVDIAGFAFRWIVSIFEATAAAEEVGVPIILA
jgi:hypothetical protein